MKTKIFYFSGTGNSLVIARDLAAALGDTELLNIAKVINEDIVYDCDNIGLVFPVYIWGPPLIVVEFIKKLRSKAQYHFAVANYGGFPAGTLLLVRDLFAAKGIKLNSGFGLMMPGNYTPLYGAKPQNKQAQMFKNEKDKIKEIGHIIKNRATTKIPKNNFFINWLFTTLLYKKSAPQIKKLAKDFWVSEKCDGCEICVRICPSNNIKLKDNKPQWGDNCEQCLACLQWCPQEAIEYGKSTIGRKRYHHPDVSLKDLLA